MTICDLAQKTIEEKFRQNVEAHAVTTAWLRDNLRFGPKTIAGKFRRNAKAHAVPYPLDSALRFYAKTQRPYCRYRQNSSVTISDFIYKTIAQKLN